jgi:signal transduction histidine kinase
MQFRTKARAVDLLGKGQIADLPTAITELWKNGFDAYADNLSAEIFLKDYKGLESPMFMMTDDGKGMSKAEVFDKWLVLGTDSKSRIKNQDVEGEETLYKKPRIKAGEKGIGRLSVAFLGSPMLMLTKKRGHTLQALFFDWRLLENYNLFLDDVQIPVIEIEDQQSFRNNFKELQKEFLLNFEIVNDIDGKPIWEEEQVPLKKTILNSIKSIKLPDFFEKDILKNLLDQKEDHGTKFLIFEPEEQIINLLKTDSNDENIEVRNSLAGFNNPFIKDQLPVKTSFPIHKTNGNDYDFLTSKGNFFEPKDYEFADILIDGDFNGKGKFKGKVKIYEKEIDYQFKNNRNSYKNTDYGSFSIKLGYSQGFLKDSKLESSLWDKINKKVTDFGGLYIYRDGFRVLPYGKAEADFLEFEQRRAKRIGTYYFGHRRMFGFIGLERDRNKNLKDKSSREGLINNSAYRCFKNDLIALFVDLANEYFSDKAKQSIFLDEKKKYNEQAEALKDDIVRTRKEKIAYSKSLKEYPIKFDKYKSEYKDLIDNLTNKVSQVNLVYSEIEDLLSKINKLDIGYKDLFPETPKSYEPTELQLDRLSKYAEQIIDFNGTIKKESKGLMLEVQKRLEVKDLQNEFAKNSAEYKAALEKLLYDNKSILSNKSNYLNQEFSKKSAETLKDLDFQKEKILTSIKTKEDVINGLKIISEKFEFLREQIKKEMLPLVQHIEKLGFDIDEELVQGAYKAEYENIKSKWEQTRETAQLGIAVEIIDHEFNVLYSQINSSINRIQKDVDPKVKSDFNNLKSFFKALEDKYALLSPLYRISGVIPKEIICDSIYNYLKKFFERKMLEEEVIFTATTSFKKHTLEIKEPVIHTVFINLINNALYWIRNSDRKEIILDYNKATEEILIINSGQKIESHRLEKIFELFYSNRPSGRGIGLYLSRESLQESYYDIYATNDIKYNRLDGACFVIKKID